jgi:hypothetical protein
MPIWHSSNNCDAWFSTATALNVHFHSHILLGGNTYYNNYPKSSSILPPPPRSARRNAFHSGQATNLSGDIVSPVEEHVNFTEEDVHATEANLQGAIFRSPFLVSLDDLTANLH